MSVMLTLFIAMNFVSIFAQLYLGNYGIAVINGIALGACFVALLKI